MAIDKIIKLLQEKIGLYAQSIGESSVRSAIDIRLQQTKLKSKEQYYDLLVSSRMEFDALVEEIVVPETWFFRYQQSFACISEHLSKKVKSTSDSLNPSRILSFPCSTGEEPYSVLIQLAQANIALQNVSIDAADISKRCLKKARLGVYSLATLKQVSVKLRDRYFTRYNDSDDQYQILKRFREHVNFKLNNFLVGSISPRPAYYDVILCRNLLIYFDSNLQNIALEKLHRALKPDGLLILGHAESSTISSRYFRRFGDERTHAFHRVNKSNTLSLPSAQSIKEEAAVSTDWRNIFSQQTQQVLSNEETRDLCQQYDGVDEISLRLLEKMIQKKQYSVAEELITKRLQTKPDDPAAHYLLALIKYREGDKKTSESILNKVIYLEPSHEKSMHLLKSIAQDNADMDSVTKFERRLQRIKANKNK